MTETNQHKAFSLAVDEPELASPRSILTEFVVQLWQFLIDTYTAYLHFLWLKQRQRTRLQLLELSDEQLKDIGISRPAANEEGNKFFWE